MIVNDSVIRELGKRCFQGSMPKEIQRYFRQMILLDECLTETLCNFKSCQHDIDDNKYLRDFIAWKNLEEEFQHFRENARLARISPPPEPPEYILPENSRDHTTSGSLEEAGLQGQSPA